MAYVHDNIQGIAVDNYVGGTDFSDNISGTAARDLIIGEAGMDVITGGKGADIMYGGNRTFYLPAGTNVDNGQRYEHLSYYGDGLADRFVFNAGDSGMGSGNRDLIRGFDVGTDKIDLRSMGPDLNFAFSVVADKVLINIDANHDGKWDMQISVVTNYLDPPSSFSAADFLVM